MITVEQILTALQDCDFTDLCDGNFFTQVIQCMDSSILPRSYNTGATKLVLTPPGENFVIKIPFRGGKFGKKYEPFERAQEPDGWDYCKAEVIKYQKAKEIHVEQYFVETRYIGSVQGHPIYIQEAVDIYNEVKDFDDYDDEHREKTRQTCKDLNIRCFNSGWLTDFLEYFSSQELIKLQEHLTNTCIGDLHGDNLGYLYNGQPVIVDYADYWE